MALRLTQWTDLNFSHEIVLPTSKQFSQAVMKTLY